MSFIDFKTATFLIGLLYLIMPTVVWIVMMRERNRPVRLWCLGGLGYGLGLMLV